MAWRKLVGFFHHGVTARDRTPEGAKGYAGLVLGRSFAAFLCSRWVGICNRLPDLSRKQPIARARRPFVPNLVTPPYDLPVSLLTHALIIRSLRLVLQISEIDRNRSD